MCVSPFRSKVSLCTGWQTLSELALVPGVVWGAQDRETSSTVLARRWCGTCSDLVWERNSYLVCHWGWLRGGMQQAEPIWMCCSHQTLVLLGYGALMCTWTTGRKQVCQAQHHRWLWDPLTPWCSDGLAAVCRYADGPNERAVRALQFSYWKEGCDQWRQTCGCSPVVSSKVKSLLKQEHQRAVRGAVRLEACAEQPLCIKERRLFLWLRAAWRGGELKCLWPHNCEVLPG